jgi:hypothetical protein
MSRMDLVAKETIFFIAMNGNDTNNGTIQFPFASWERAKDAVRKETGNVTVFFRKGTYYLDNTISFDQADSGSPDRQILYAAYPGEEVVISGAISLKNLNWVAWKDGIFQADITKECEFDQLFVNGVRRIRARYPNFDYVNPKQSGSGYIRVVDGSNLRYDTWVSYDSTTFSKKSWSKPSTGIVHAFQSLNWGNLQYHISGLDTANKRIILGKGGWQLQRSAGIGRGRGESSPFYVENVFEELDQPGEWFFDSTTKKLYYYPLPGEDLLAAHLEVPILKDLVQLRGKPNSPIRFIRFVGLKFTHAKTTFLDSYEPVSRGDWAIHRGGALFVENSEDISIEDCNFEYLGGNAVFVSKYARRVTVSGCRFFHTGESAVCFVGDSQAARSYVTWDDLDLHKKYWGFETIKSDLKPGPRTDDYPLDCIVKNCKAYELGDFGKQVAAVFISKSSRITVSHCSVFKVPRAAICINDGTWGGHIIEHNDIWETVRETGEHGPFNSWGRDRFWLGPWGNNETIKDYVLLDALAPTVIRNNKFSNVSKSISAGNWAIDLDDGSSNFHIYSNLNLGSTLKLRDGFHRKVWNNIFVGPVPIGWHVWPEASEDEFYHNITVISGVVPGQKYATETFFKPILMPVNIRWSEKIDSNLYYNANVKTPRMTADKTYEQWQQAGYDQHSLITNPIFADPENEDYRVLDSSPALKIGFKNFPMDIFGHTMTRAKPRSGTFGKTLKVVLLPDARGEDIHYTLDGTDPTLVSRTYTEPILLDRTLTLKAQTFKNGSPVGFSMQEEYIQDENKTVSSWLKTLLAPEIKSALSDKPSAGHNTAVNWFGAIVNNIKDGDLIDATGGYDRGAFVLKVVNEDYSYRWGIRANDIIIAVNDKPINRKEDLFEQQYAVSRVRSVTIMRGYKTLKLTIK